MTLRFSSCTTSKSARCLQVVDKDVHVALLCGLNVGQWNPSRLLNNWLFLISFAEAYSIHNKWSGYVTWQCKLFAGLFLIIVLRSKSCWAVMQSKGEDTPVDFQRRVSRGCDIVGCPTFALTHHTHTGTSAFLQIGLLSLLQGHLLKTFSSYALLTSTDIWSTQSSFHRREQQCQGTCGHSGRKHRKTAGKPLWSIKGECDLFKLVQSPERVRVTNMKISRVYMWMQPLF